MILEFETLGGIDALEECQVHSDHTVYKMAQRILLKYFEPDSDGDPIVRFLNSVEYSERVETMYTQQDGEVMN